jgi:histidyl-tRNA synthetase
MEARGQIQAVRGFRDVLGREVSLWQRVEAVTRDVLERYGFREVRIPILERTELFARSIGESTDIVEKEMYSFSDRSGVSVTLRPEATAGILRAYIEHSLWQSEPVEKLYCMGPMFRYERPQKGRYRQFHQIDAEVLGSADPRTDAELLAALRALFQGLGLEELEFQINSLGCPECRPGFRARVVSYLEGRREALCADCSRRLSTNPLRIYDCKVEGCRKALEGAPSILEGLCSDCAQHLERVKEHLSLLGVPFSMNPFIVRGLDYYRRTTFEVLSGELGAQNAVCGGGRYDGLIKDLGGPDLPGIGFAIGQERLVSILQQREEHHGRGMDLFVASLGESAAREAFLWVERARKAGMRAEMDFRGGSLKAQLRRADRLGARRVLILGETELLSGKAPLRDMAEGIQTEVRLTELETIMAGWAGAPAGWATRG